VPLEIHTNFSLLKGAAHITDLIGRAAELGYEAIGLADDDALYCAPPFYRTAVQAGLKPLVGVNLTAGSAGFQPACGQDGRAPNFPRRAVIIARDIDGYRAICRLITLRRMADEFSLPDVLASIGASVFAIVTDPALLVRALKLGGGAEWLLAGIVRAGEMGEASRNRDLMRICDDEGVRPVALTPVFFAYEDGYEIHRMLRAIATLSTIGTLPEHETVPKTCYLRSPADIAALYEDIPQAVLNAGMLAAECDFKLERDAWYFPHYEPPDGRTPFEELFDRTYTGLRRRYRPLKQDAVRRLTYELEVIEKLGFTDYFLVVDDIRQWANDRGYRTVGRGSAANSIVSFALGITDVDPLRHNLYFERFLNPERKSPPDIDLDFSWRRRDEVLEYVYDRFGRDRVAMICSYVTFAARSSVREVCKALGIPDNEIKRITSLIPHVHAAGDMTRKHPECRELDGETEPMRTILRITNGIAGFPRHLSVHAGGIVIAPRPLTDFLPLEMAAKGLVVTQYDMYGVEDVGLIKLDLLCQRSLGVLEDAHREAEKYTGGKIDVYNYELSLNDAATKRLIREGRTMGCFYIESPGMRNLLRKLRTETFEDLTAASSVIRPGVAESGMMDQYISRHRDPSKIEYLHPLMEELLGETHGVMIYQEDVLKVVHHLGGLSLAEADLLRRAMSGKLRSRTAMQTLKGNFLRSCLEKGIDPEIVMEIWRQVASFADYAFCKAHSASYALLSFQCAYMKAHFPAEFMAGVLSNQGGFYGAGAYIEEARRLGIRILLPDINHSEHDYIGHDDWVRVGLMAPRGLRSESLESILRARDDGGPFADLDDFIRRTDVGFEEARSLIRLGAMESLGCTRPQLMAELYASPLAKDRAAREESRAPMLLHAPQQQVSVPADCGDYTLRQKCAIEADALGYLVSAHPLDLFRSILDKYDIVSASKIGQYAGRKVRMAGWMIAARRISTRRGDRYMKFMSMEDKTGTYEVTLFPNAYRRLAPKTMSQGPYIFDGTVDDHFGVCSLNCINLNVLERLPPDDGERMGPDVREMGIAKVLGPGGFWGWTVS